MRYGKGEEGGHTLRAGQRAHDFGWNGHYEDEAVRNDTLAMLMLWENCSIQLQITDYVEDKYQVKVKDAKSRGQQRRKS